jgi:threonine dehydratase
MAVAPGHIEEHQLHEAAAAISGTVRETPVLSAGELSRRVGTRVRLKAENLQVTGSFKARGAMNSIRQLSEEELAAGVVAASAGNHAQAVAFAARSAGSTALLVMPERASLAKVAAVRQYGGEVVFVDGGYDEAQAEAARLSAERGMRVVHAFDQPEVVAGQATVGLEIARQAQDTRLVVVRSRPRCPRRGSSASRPPAALPTSTRWRRTGPSALAPPTRSATGSLSSAPATSPCRSSSATSTRS